MKKIKKFTTRDIDLLEVLSKTDKGLTEFEINEFAIRNSRIKDLCMNGLISKHMNYATNEMHYMITNQGRELL